MGFFTVNKQVVIYRVLFHAGIERVKVICAQLEKNRRFWSLNSLKMLILRQIHLEKCNFISISSCTFLKN